MNDPARAKRILDDVRATGVRVSIDDFGVGHSSLAYARTLPASEIKIDRSFVRDVATESHDAAVVRAAVGLAHDLGLAVTAEGVETRAALERLVSLGCDCAQGYFIARPMSADDAMRWACAARSDHQLGAVVA